MSSGAPEAFNRVEEILLRASNPDAVVAAVLELDRMLAEDPIGNSEDRPGDRWVAFARPLGVLFRMDETAQMVEVVSLWLIRPR